MDWWTSLLPVEQTTEANHRLVYQSSERAFTAQTAATLASNAPAPDPEFADLVMLVRPRKSRIFYLRKLFDYPLKLDLATLQKLGAVRTAKAGLSYVASAIWPVRPEKTLEDFFINRFGTGFVSNVLQELHGKGVGRALRSNQRGVGSAAHQGPLSAQSSVASFQEARRRQVPAEIGQKDTETSLIEKFLYPKLGPGQLWEEVASRVRAEGGEILTGWTVCGIHTSGRST